MHIANCLFRLPPAWHGLCILLLLSGCYFPWPLIEEQSNVPPQIVSSSPGPEEDFVLAEPLGSAFVFASDENDLEALEFFWSVGGENLGQVTPIAGDAVRGSRVVVPFDRGYIGDTLRCQVFDGQAALAERSWLVVGEEAE